VGNDRSWNDSGEEARFLYLQSYLYKGGYMFGDTQVEGIRADKIANPDAKWETGRKFNAGLETAFWKNRITFSVDYFNEYRSDILTNVAVATPAFVGAVFANANIGKTLNQGIEVELSGNYQISREFSVFARGNFSFARNKVLEYGTPDGVLPYQRPEGFPIDMPLKYITLGYFQSYEEIENSPSQLGIEDNMEVKPGDLKYKDINGDGIINKDDKIHVGFPTTPEIQYGITLGLNWKNWDISALVQGTACASFDKNWEIMWHFSNNQNVFPKHWYYWTPEAGDARSQYVELAGKWQNNEAGADYTLSSGSFVRLKNLDLGYTLPAAFTNKLGMGNVRLYVSALNLFTWASEKGLDPDNRNSRGARMPPSKSINAGINVNF
jgi:outer membrane receptor protein involved in Fe transport